MSRASRTARPSSRNTRMAIRRRRGVAAGPSARSRRAARSRGLTVSGNQLYLSARRRTALSPPRPGDDRQPQFRQQGRVRLHLTDQGASARPDFVSYVGTSGTETGGAVTVGSDGTVYLTGTTTGTFAGQSRSIAGNQNNMFVTSMSASGAINWTNQYGGLDGQSTGSGIAIDPTAPACSTRSACRAAPSRSTSRSISRSRPRCAPATASRSRSAASRRAPPRSPSTRARRWIRCRPKINGQLGAIGKASVNFSAGAEGLQIQANAATRSRCLGAGEFRRAVASRHPAANLTGAASTTSSSTTSKTTTGQSFGLGLDDSYDISTKTGADLARSSLLGVLGQIQNAYQTMNAPPAAGRRSGQHKRHGFALSDGADRQLQPSAQHVRRLDHRQHGEHHIERAVAVHGIVAAVGTERPDGLDGVTRPCCKPSPAVRGHRARWRDCRCGSAGSVAPPHRRSP